MRLFEVLESHKYILDFGPNLRCYFKANVGPSYWGPWQYLARCHICSSLPINADARSGRVDQLKDMQSQRAHADSALHFLLLTKQFISMQMCSDTNNNSPGNHIAHPGSPIVQLLYRVRGTKCFLFISSGSLCSPWAGPVIPKTAAAAAAESSMKNKVEDTNELILKLQNVQSANKTFINY